MNVYWSSAMYDLYPLQDKVRFKHQITETHTKHMDVRRGPHSSYFLPPSAFPHSQIESRYSVIPLNQ